MPDNILDGLSVEVHTEGIGKIIARNGADARRNTRVICSTEPGAEILGVCSFGPDRVDASIGEVYALYLSPARAGMGLGRLLMQDAVARLAEAGFGRANLWVLEGNERAISFYEKAGFRLTGKTKAENLGTVELRELQMSLGLAGVL